MRETTVAENLTPTGRSRVRRQPQRARYERDAINEILDEGLVCHVGFVAGGHPFVIPTLYARAGETLYLHGSRASRMMKALRAGAEVCVTVTLVDGLVLARSAFHHSMNYRSVVIFGRAREVEDEAEKIEALRAFTEHVVPGRWDEVRGPDAKELNATTVLAVPLDEASAKVREGDPVDDESDYEIPVWAGTLPLRLSPGEPVPDARLAPGTPVPGYVLGYRRAQKRVEEEDVSTHAGF